MTTLIESTDSYVEHGEFLGKILDFPKEGSLGCIEILSSHTIRVNRINFHESEIFFEGKSASRARVGSLAIFCIRESNNNFMGYKVRLHPKEVQNRLKEEFVLASDSRMFLTEQFLSRVDAFLTEFPTLEAKMEVIHQICRFLYTREFHERNNLIAYIAKSSNVITSKFLTKISSYEDLRSVEAFLSSISMSISNLKSRPLNIIRDIVQYEMENFEEKIKSILSEFSVKNPIVPGTVIQNSLKFENALQADELVNKDQINSIFNLITFDKEYLSDCLLSEFESIAMTSEDENAKLKAISDLDVVVKSILGESASLSTYGSFASGFGGRGSDVDICLKIPNCEDQNDQVTQKTYLIEIQNVLMKKNQDKQFFVKQTVSHSRVPILRLQHLKMGVEMDMCMGTSLGVENTKLLRTYSQIHEKVRQLVCLVKHWTKKRKISDAASGSLSSYSYVLMTVAYLQAIGMLPSLQKLIHHEKCLPSDISAPHFLNGYDCRYFCNLKKLHEIWTPKRNYDDISLAELFFGFFKYYHKIFNRHVSAVSIRLGHPSPKLWKSPLNIEDPFEIRDLGKVITNEKAPLIFAEFERAYRLFLEDDTFFETSRLNAILKETTDEVDNINIYALKKPAYNDYESKEFVAKCILRGELFIGMLRVNAKRFFEAYVTIEGFEKDIYIDGLNARNRAFHGDMVAIKIKNMEDGQYTGEVVRVVKRNSPIVFACSILNQLQPSKYAFFFPIEKIHPKICVEYREFRKIIGSRVDDMHSYLFVIRIVSWDKSSRYPRGVPVSVIGLKRDLLAQKRSIFIEHMPEMFEKILLKKPDTLISKLENLSLNIDKEIPIERDTSMDHLYKDWMNRRIFTIDPTSSRDLDDAVSINKLPNGKFKIGVYIADVTKFLTPENEHDIDAQNRCTSIYMIDVVEHMLIPALSQGEASILPNVPRTAVAIEWEMHEDGTVVFDSIELNKGHIASCCRLDYDTAQEIIEGKLPNLTVSPPFTEEEIYDDVIIMNTLAQNLRRRRKLGGAVSLNSDELYFTLDEFGYPIDVAKPHHNESHQLIEEFMLMANHLTGITLHNFFGEDAVLRRHVPPQYLEFMTTILQFGRSLNRILLASGVISDNEVHFDTTKIESAISDFEAGKEASMTMEEAMNSLVEASAILPFAQACIKHALLRHMNLGTYAREGDCIEEYKTHHFALNMDYYTHFTSPIRRYADVLVHRQVREIILARAENRRPISPIQGESLTNMIEKINAQATQAKTIQDNLNKLYLAHYVGKEMRNGKVIRVKAVVMSCGRRSFTAFIEEFGTEVQCSLMLDLFEKPVCVTADEYSDKSGDGGTQVSQIKVMWASPQNEAIIEKEMVIFPLKPIIVDVSPVFHTVPAVLKIYNIWEYSEQYNVPVALDLPTINCDIISLSRNKEYLSNIPNFQQLSYSNDENSNGKTDTSHKKERKQKGDAYTKDKHHSKHDHHKGTHHDSRDDHHKDSRNDPNGRQNRHTNQSNHENRHTKFHHATRYEQRRREMHQEPQYEQPNGHNEHLISRANGRTESIHHSHEVRKGDYNVSQEDHQIRNHQISNYEQEGIVHKNSQIALHAENNQVNSDNHINHVHTSVNNNKNRKHFNHHKHSKFNRSRGRNNHNIDRNYHANEISDKKLNQREKVSQPRSNGQGERNDSQLQGALQKNLKGILPQRFTVMTSSGVDEIMRI